jgi:large repetitive protein
MRTAIQMIARPRRRLLGALFATALVLVAFTVVAQAAAPALVYSTSPDRSSPVPLEGSQVQGFIYVVQPAATGIKEVRFYVDDPTRAGTPHRVERGAPYDLQGSNTDGTATPFDTRKLADGQHTITTQVLYSNGTNEVATYTFTTNNTGAPPALPQLKVSTSPDRSGAVALEGAQVAKQIYVFQPAMSGITKVSFWLDDIAMAGTPRQVETAAPWDFAGSNGDGTAKAFDTRGLQNGQHTVTTAVEINGATEAYTTTFNVLNPSLCDLQDCSTVKVGVPYELDFTDDRGALDDTNGVGTGFTWIQSPRNGTGYIPANLAIDKTNGLLNVTTTAGLAQSTSNSGDNVLGVGIDGPSQISAVSATVKNPPAGTGNNEQAGVWFGIDEDNYLKLNLASTSTGTKIQSELEVGAARSGSKKSSGTIDLTGASVRLMIVADPNTQIATVSYSINGGPKSKLGEHVLPPEFFSFDGAGIDPRLGTRTFGGIFTSHRSGVGPLVYSFDDFLVADGSVPPPPSTTGFEFTRAAIPVAFPTALAVGPDNALYVATLFGDIHRITLGPDKQVVSDQVISTLGSRLTLGLTIDPRSTADDVSIWVSHSSPSLNDGVPNSSVVSRLSGPGLATREDVITGLPRAKANHATNNIRFGPDGRLYIAQGGNTGAGAPNQSNTEFGTMEEQPLSAAMLVANVFGAGFDGSCHNETNIFGPPPCDVQIYSSGLRNTYDFVWHSNGHLYAPNNGLGVDGSFPPSPTPDCFGFASTAPWNQGGHNPGPQPDVLNRLVAGRYYGHPNPYRDECVFDDGRYQGVSALPNFTPPLLNLGDHRSANGTIEYGGAKFCGDLRREILIANYSVGDNITRTRLSEDGMSVVAHTELISGFKDPLPLAQSPDGTIYVGEFAANKVTALVPINTGCWTGRAPLPEQLLDVGGDALGGKVYVVAGKPTSDGHQTDVHVYDPATDSYSIAAPLPGPGVENPAVVAHDGRLYAFGGSTAPFSGAVSNAAVYDPATNSWTPLAPMPTARGGAFARVIGGKIYVGGGMDANGASLATVDVYDVATGAWSSVAPMSTRRDNPGAGVANGKLYVFGGRTRNADGTTENGTLNTVEVFDPALNDWDPKAPMITGRRTFMVGQIGGRFQVMGGEPTPSGGAFVQNEEYDPATDSWRSLRNMKTGRHGGAAGTINGVVYVIGGGARAGFAVSDINESFSFPPDN